MTEYNIYASYNCEHNFAAPAWIANEIDGLTEKPDDAWNYIVPLDIKSINILLFCGRIDKYDYTFQVLDAVSEQSIPGTITEIPNGPMIKMRYTFKNVLSKGAVIKCLIQSDTIPKQNLKFVVNITIE